MAEIKRGDIRRVDSMRGYNRGDLVLMDGWFWLVVSEEPTGPLCTVTVQAVRKEEDNGTSVHTLAAPDKP